MALASWGTYARPRKLKKICLTVAGRQRKVNILICRQPRLLLRGGRQGSTYPNVMERLTGWTFHQAKPRLSSLVSLLSLSVFGPRPGIGGASNNDENAVSCRRRNNVAVRLIFLRLYEKIRAEVIVV
jgi:hypothetical protein